MSVMRKLGKQLRESRAEIRIEKCIWLLNVYGSQTASPDLKDEFWDEDDSEIKSVLGLEGKWFDEALENRDFEMFCELLCDAGKEGMLIQAATPVPSHFTGTGYRTSGFGHYTTKWFYTESLEELIPRIVAWGDEYIETKRKEAA